MHKIHFQKLKHFGEPCGAHESGFRALDCFLCLLLAWSTEETFHCSGFGMAVLFLFYCLMHVWFNFLKVEFMVLFNCTVLLNTW